ncbi:MAG: nitroreductase family protein [Candidatus Aenigmarchaeota archaeon]|nr:nitroreductase family protein [Candidatus Aenigmarchaeota archaeon]
MDFFECVLNLGKTTKFLSKEVDDRTIGIILHAATHAPSAGEIKEWHFFVIKDKETKDKLVEAALMQKFISLAPVVITVAVDIEKVTLKYFERGERLYAIQDGGHACMLIILTAHALGLGSYLIRAFDEEKVRRILEMPDHMRPLALITIGYPAESPEPVKSIPFENITWVDRYGKRFEGKVEDVIASLEKMFKKKEKKEEVLPKLEEEF